MEHVAVSHDSFASDSFFFFRNPGFGSHQRRLALLAHRRCSASHDWGPVQNPSQPSAAFAASYLPYSRPAALLLPLLIARRSRVSPIARAPERRTSLCKINRCRSGVPTGSHCQGPLY